MGEINVKNKFNLWLENAVDDSDLIAELKSVADDENEVYERFYRELEFGTAGLRGVIGAGTNRMNIYVVRRTTQGLANFLKKKYGEAAVAISYDSRIKADYFAQEAARVLAANGIKVYISRELQPTPVLSFLVRELKCKSGIMVTASHNPAKYNGYKCYGEDGCQMTDVNAGTVYDEIQKVDIFNDVKLVDFEEGIKSGLIEWVDESVYETYLDNVQAQTVNKDICKNAGLKVVYTPLNGAGNKLVRKILARIGVEDITVVPEQENPDGNFTTCPYPNPELREALGLGLKPSEKVGADLLLATDPDSDRVGIAVKTEDGYRLLTGNETGILLMDYVLSCRKANGTLPKKPVAVKTIVTSKLVERICEKYGCELRNVLTGFKYIGEQILVLEKNGEESRYVFGFEESYGYLAGTYVRDKDAVVASMLICEMAAFYRSQGISLVQARAKMYSDYGFYCNKLDTFTFEGETGMKKMNAIMDTLRNEKLDAVAGLKVIGKADYKLSVKTDYESGKTEELTLPKSNVITFYLEDNASVVIRPSGTEPKIKLYYTTVGTSVEDAAEKQVKLSADFTKIVG